MGGSMRLRNKSTGEIRDADAFEDGIYLWDDNTERWYKYDLDILAEGWEYYTAPKEPLIKDEKVREAVRAWAEANCIEDNDRVLIRRWDAYDFVEIEREYKIGIRFYLTTIDRILELENRTYYTIAELCGEEE